MALLEKGRPPPEGCAETCLFHTNDRLQLVKFQSIIPIPANRDVTSRARLRMPPDWLTLSHVGRQPSSYGFMRGPTAFCTVDFWPPRRGLKSPRTAEQQRTLKKVSNWWADAGEAAPVGECLSWRCEVDRKLQASTIFRLSLETAPRHRCITSRLPLCSSMSSRYV